MYVCVCVLYTVYNVFDVISLAFRCHVPVSEKTLLGMAAATGELQLYTLSDGQVRNMSPDKRIMLEFAADFRTLFPDAVCHISPSADGIMKINGLNTGHIKKIN